MSEDFRTKIMELADSAKAKYGHQVWDWDVIEKLKGKVFQLTLLGLLLKQHDEIKRLSARVATLERNERHSSKR